MSLNKKKSRLISIDNEQFRWVISPDSGFIVFVAEKETIKGRKIEVYISSNDKIIKPKDSESIIRQALDLGWNFIEKGKPIVFDLIEEKLVSRKK